MGEICKSVLSRVICLLPEINSTGGMAETGEQFVKACQTFIACTAGRKPSEPATIQDISSLVHLMQCMYTSFAPALAVAAKLHDVDDRLKHANDELNLLRGKVADMARSFNEQLRFSYDCNLLVHGVEEKEDESSDEVRKAALTVLASVPSKPKNADIELIHRLGKKLPGKTRPILCRFINRSMKRRVVSEFFSRTKQQKAEAASPDEANMIRSPVTNHLPFKKFINVDDVSETGNPSTNKKLHVSPEGTNFAKKKHHRARR